jgi:hypothetical protein
MERKILAVVTGMITAVCIIWIAYMIGTMIAPNTPKNAATSTNEELVAYMQTLPLSSFVAVAAGYFVAAFAGGYISTNMGRRWGGGMALAVVVGILLTVGAVLTSFVWPQPTNFLLVSLLIFIPSSLLGYRFAR